MRRLRLPLPLTAAYCRCRRRQDALGDHLAACPRSGVLRARGAPLERAAARVCREAGASVATNVLVRDLNVAPSRQDDRRIEVIANGLPLWGGVQVAVDTTLVSPLAANGEPRREARRTAGLPCATLAGRRSALTRNSATRDAAAYSRPRHRNRRQMERGSCYLPPAPCPLPSPVCPPTTAKCLHLCLCAAVVRPARMCRCACLRKQPPLPTAFRCSQCRRRSSPFQRPSR